jgi:hypothetical protein
METAQRQNLLRFYITLCLAEGLAALIWLTLAQTGSLSGFLAGFSLGRLALLAPCLLLVGALCWSTVILWRDQSTAEKWSQKISSLASGELFYWGILALSGGVLLVGIYLQAFAARTADSYLAMYHVRLAPYAWWGVILAIQTPVALRLLRYGASLDAFALYRATFRAFLIASGILLLLSIWILVSGTGLRADAFGWGAPGVPILPSQVVLGLVIVCAMLVLAGVLAYLWQRAGTRFPRRLSKSSLDILIFLLLWLVAAWRWGTEPLKPAYFVTAPMSPNYELYPYSDSSAYDLSAQQLLLGLGFESDVIRPVYSLFLALAQGASGIGYENVIAWQVPILALIPPLLYLVAKTIHHRLSGLLLGLLAVFHESNSIALSGVINVSHAKLLMSDMPITLGMILLSLLVILWLRHAGRKPLYPLLAGGTLAVFMLIRFQIILVLPAILICSWLALRKDPATWIKNGLVFIAALLLTLTPWVWRNYELTGKIILADTSNPTQAGMVMKRYSLALPQDSSDRNPGETEEEYLERMTGSITSFALAHPLETIRFINAHFWHNQVATLLALPSSLPVLSALHKLELWQANPQRFWSLCCTTTAYIRNLGYWANDWNGTLAANSTLPLAISLVMIALGLGATWAGTRYAGLAPLFISAAYTLGNALARNSGWRYNLPVEWVGMLFYAIGIVQMCFWAATFFKNTLIPPSWKNEYPEAEGTAPFPWKQASLCALGFFLLVASIPLAERLIPNHFQALTPQSVLSSLYAAQSDGGDRTQIKTFLKEENAVAFVGRIFYPRFYLAGEGAVSPNWASYHMRDYPRLGFILLGPRRESVILRLDQPPDTFPNAADSLVIGCQRDTYVEAYLVAILTDPQQMILSSRTQPWSCNQP